jgi:hypothetical protein
MSPMKGEISKMSNISEIVNNLGKHIRRTFVRLTCHFGRLDEVKCVYIELGAIWAEPIDILRNTKYNLHKAGKNEL